MVLERANREACLGSRVVEEPEREVDVMDGTVDEDAAVALRVRDEEARLVEEVAGVASHQVGRANGAGFDFGMGVAVGGVEAAREAGHDF